MNCEHKALEATCLVVPSLREGVDMLCYDQKQAREQSGHRNLVILTLSNQKAHSQNGMFKMIMISVSRATSHFILIIK